MVSHFVRDHSVPFTYFFETGFFGKQILMVHERGRIYLHDTGSNYPAYGDRKATKLEAEEFMKRFNKKTKKKALPPKKD